MKSERGRDIQVGVMVVIGIVILIAGLMFFKRVRLGSENVVYAVDFPAVEGLRQGDRVHVRGIRVGQVTRFEFLPGTVRTYIEVEDWVNLYPNAKIALVMKGLVGEVLIEIEPGDGNAVVMPGHVFVGRNAASMLALGDRVNEGLDYLTALAEELRLLVEQVRHEGQIVGTMAAAQRTLLSTEGMIEENRANLRSMTASMASLTASLDEMMASGTVDSTLRAVRMSAAGLDSTMIVLRATLQDSRDIMAGIKAGEGTIGKLVTDETLYDQADSTLYSLHRLLDRMRRDPKAMFKMSVF